VAGTFKLGFLPNHHFAYSALTRQRTDYSFNARTEKEGDIFEELPGDELFSGRFKTSSKYKEEWMSLTWSYALNENFSVGVTNTYSKTSSLKTLETKLELLYENDTKVAQLLRTRHVDFSNDGFLWKFGMAWSSDITDLGVTVTTPMIHIGGRGSFLYEDVESGLPDSLQLNQFEVSSQGGLSARHESPLSVGGGASFKLFKKHLFHIGIEWFQSIPRYTIVEAEPFIGQSTGTMIEFTLYDQAEQVINYGAGLELSFSEKLSMYASYSSDYSYVNEDITRITDYDTEASNSSFRADINHIGSGFVLKLKKADITLGLTYAWATETIPRPIDFPDEGEEGIFNPDETTELVWSRWRFIFSFSIPFLKDLEEKL